MLYPVNLDISNRLCLVVGGGAVAARKIESLLRSGAIVRVVSPEACGKIRGLAAEGQIEWLVRGYNHRDMWEAFLVFAATNSDDVQKQIAEQAVKYGVLLNSASKPEGSDFHVPAKIRRGNLLITVSTGGSSPALSTLIKKKLGTEFGSEYGTLLELMAQLRREIISDGEPSEQNRLLFHEILQLPILACIRDRRWHDLRSHLTRVLPKDIDCDLLISRLKTASAAPLP